MPAVRITVTIDEETLDELKQRVGPGELSAYVVEALRHRLRIDPIEELLAQPDSIHGPLTEADLEQGAAWLSQMMQRLSSTQAP